MSILDKSSLVMLPSGYKEDKLYSVKPRNGDGDFTFTRASTGTRVNADGYIEEVAWNKSTYSEDFTNSSYVKNNCTVTADQADSPTGTTTADQIDFGSGSGFFYNNVTTITQPSTYSIYVKYIDYQFIQIIGTGDVDHYANFDIQNGIVGNTGSQSTASIEDAGNGWYRCIINYNDGTFAGGARLYKTTSLTAGWAGGGGVAGSFYFWGNQLVKGNAPKPYIKTTDRLDIPRLDYSGGATNPTLLLEPQRTNYVPDSESWTGFSGTGVTKYANQTDINGGSQAMRIVYASGVVGYPGFNLGGTRTGKASIYIKSNTADTYNMRMSSNTSAAQNITVTPTWQRITVDAVNWTIMSLDNYDNGVWAAADISTCFWQMEQGSYPTSYIPTSGTSVTRNDESFVADSLGTIIGQTEGCIFIDFVYYEGNRFEIFDASSTADGFLIYRSGTTYNLQVGNGGSYWAITNFINGLTIGTQYKLAINYKLNDYKVYVNGSQTATNTSIEVPTTNKIISSQSNGTNKFTNHINEFMMFDQFLTDDELEELTTI